MNNPEKGKEKKGNQIQDAYFSPLFNPYILSQHTPY